MNKKIEIIANKKQENDYVVYCHLINFHTTMEFTNDFPLKVGATGIIDYSSKTKRIKGFYQEETMRAELITKGTGGKVFSGIGTFKDQKGNLITIETQISYLPEVGETGTVIYQFHPKEPNRKAGYIMLDFIKD